MSDDPDESVRFQNPEADQRLAEARSLWHYAPQLLRYPVRGYALGVVIALAILMRLSLFAGIFGLAMDGLLAGGMCFYLLEVVGETITGRARPPAFGTEFFSEIQFGAIALMLAYLTGLVLVPTYLGAFHDNRAAAWFGYVMLFLLPAFIALLAIEDHFWSALNPIKLVAFILQMGWAYLPVCLIMVGSLWLALLIGTHLLGTLALMLLIYCAIVACHTLGFVAYHRQDQLGLTVAVEKPNADSQKLAARTAALKRLLDRIDRLTAANNAHAAVPLILTPVDEPVEPRIFYQDLYEALRIRRNWALALTAGQKLIALLARQSRQSRALDIYAQCVDVTPQFEPSSTELCVTLAQAAVQAKRFPLFEKIVSLTSARHPGSDVAVSLQFLRARYLAEFKHDDAAALALLGSLRAATQHPWQPRIEALYRALDASGRKDAALAHPAKP